MGFVFILENSCRKENNSDPVIIVTDIDGNIYHTVTIGLQVWMSENLKVTRYNDSTSIPNVTDDLEWYNLSTAAYADYNNSPGNVATYGRLYNWFAVNTGKLAPKGWHIPTNDEWTTLENYMIANSYNYDGTKTGSKIGKSLASTFGWLASTKIGAVGYDLPSNNKSGFTALPGGRRWDSGIFYGQVVYGVWWSSTEGNAGAAWGRMIHFDFIPMLSYDFPKKSGFSVRCIQDN